MKRLIYFLSVSLISAMDSPNVHNTYNGKPITPDSLRKLTPQLTGNLKEKTDQLMKEYGEFISQLVTQPKPLTHESRKKKSEDNFALINKLEEQKKVKNLSDFNYVLQFTEYPGFTVPINRWGSRVAYLVYASGQGSVLDPKFNRNFDCSKLEGIPSYQHCSRAAYYLRFKEIAEKKGFRHLFSTPTYLKHIPMKPEQLSDENYVVIQEWIPNLKELGQFEEEEQTEIVKKIPLKALNEM